MKTPNVNIGIALIIFILLICVILINFPSDYVIMSHTGKIKLSSTCSFLEARKILKKFFGNIFV